jgi:uncharacterized membrane protein HdeD (DUF308 family)
MSISRVFGVVLLVGGIFLIVFGAIASRSMADQMNSMFAGRLTQGTTWYIFGGIASAVVGLLLTVGVVGRNRS